MEEEAQFQQALDKHLDGARVRLQFARWLADRGDWRAAGYFYMARHGKNPYQSFQTWEWWQDASANPPEIRLLDDIWRSLPVEPASGYPRCKEWRSRREAEEALCQRIFEKRFSR